MKKYLNIAIDGPSSAGKSTLAKMIANKLNIAYLDTGAMYRCLAYYMLDISVDIYNEEQVKENLKNINFSIYKNESGFVLLLNNQNLSDKIRNQKISMAASDISKLQVVRDELVKIQRDIASKYDIVLDGRDITSVVLKDSKYKFYLDASVEKRAKRRYEELKQKQENIKYEEILNDIKKRDENDKNRKNSPLILTEDSIYVDNTTLSIEETVNFVVNKIKEIQKNEV